MQVVQNELETAKREIVELKDLCKSVRSEVEADFLQKQAQFEIMLSREQQSKKSLLDTLEKIQLEKNEQEQLQQENDKTIMVKLDKEIKEAEERLTEKYEENAKLKSELSQVNMECVMLKKQLSTPLREASTLANKLEAEKKFSETLKEELLLFKNKAASLEEECQSLKEQIKELDQLLDSKKETLPTRRENEILVKDIAHLKAEIESLLQELSGHNNIIHELSHKNTVLTEENTDVGKELSDMKQIIIEMRREETAREEEQRGLLSKVSELKSQKDKYMAELFSLRQALDNICSDFYDLSGLAEEDHFIINNLKKQLSFGKHRGAGDGLWNKLSVTETDIHEICPVNSPGLNCVYRNHIIISPVTKILLDLFLILESELLDDLTDLVQHEVDVSVQLDKSLLQTINPHQNKKVSIMCFNSLI